MNNYKLSEIWIYPIKSLSGIQVKKANVLPKGLEYDRRWMLIDEYHKFITQRSVHSLSLFRQTLEGDRLTIHFSGDEISFSTTAPPSPEQIKSKVWEDQVTVCEVDKKISHWFSQKLGINCRLVTFPESNSRPVDSKYALTNDQVSLADGYPFLIIGQSSLDDLNKRLGEPVPMNRFRPNLVFTGGLPYEEDSWRKFTIGKNKFAGVKPCSRCVLTTINQQTGKAGKEPLATLSRYRTLNGKVYFGQNLLALTHHDIQEGDQIILE